ncbi:MULTISPECIES: tRNA (adenosine(37)-N6)-threonylcarbamoyltransferase complex dimerization subunit type 1 TsaB [Actinomyces]|uniref:tRNA (Adenosine(37)-N6)-threonylcarbamoyltransferase complex dimerization subunit type 1 TsaB n=1 Tax=Actinomyces respiraculi TaxID=2744574 RepID=A0A7T0LK74_9ACTO|nr:MULTISPECIES: tRNA (adenosine(37)-N6)-threonylcarbamoyltransferase complex dimerization subunit type 1 TsaB [Actinomyces]QPL04946.1 tRNA (adenosine(37)-N6)-threonylcarbamoyltransferase complex dimerization subunit type 1 TsaB [Actinomyces respiraculi]
MRILSIDSSLGTELLVCDVSFDDGRAALTVLAHPSQPDSRRHAESLGPMLASALEDPKVVAHRLDAVVAATGPAPFTGLRAGLVSARTVARVRDVPVHGVPSLDAVARAALDELGEGSTVRVLTDARRQEVYTALYRAQGPDDVERLSDIEVRSPADLPTTDADAVAGSGARLYPAVVADRPVLVPSSGDATAQVRVALARLAAGQGPLDTEPLYLRHADAQVPVARKRAR